MDIEIGVTPRPQTDQKQKHVAHQIGIIHLPHISYLDNHRRITDITIHQARVLVHVSLGKRKEHSGTDGLFFLFVFFL